MADLAPLAVTCGEPAGIGPEVIAKAYAADGPPLCVLGNPSHFHGWAPRVIEISDPSQAPRAMERGLPVFPVPIPGPARPGQPDAAQAGGVIAAIARAVALAQSGQVSGIVTAPIHKRALQTGADFAYPGHTEYLAALAGDCDVVMMLAAPELRVVPATIHIPLSDVPKQLTPKSLEKTIQITNTGLKQAFGLTHPRIAVAGLNPHAGESGAMGREEIEWIAPLLTRLNAQGLSLTGPHPADTLFHAAARKHYDVALCMYHDQALIPLKTLDFYGGVNITLGLPFVRTSPDHGTAFDIAGRGRANPASMRAAIAMAAEMAQRRAHQSASFPR